jgi:hypothetical protein
MSTRQNSFTLKAALSVFLAVFTTFNTFSDLSIQAQQECYKDNRDGSKYLEFLFIEQPKHKLEAALSKAQTFLLAAGVLTILKESIYNFVQVDIRGLAPLKEPKFMKALIEIPIVDEKTGLKTGAAAWVEVKKPDSGISIPHMVAQGAISKLGYDMYANYMKKSIQKETLVNFLKNLDSHKTHIPAELVPAFSELADKYNANPESLTDSNVAQKFEIIQHLLEHTFSARYKSETKSPDILGTLKAFSDLGKNFNS